ncbi:hypothetical protein KAR26_04290 [Candidatus Parcubacteria bacterium]|nr:hypothetical protein [Candidatus Parcubacteria bacterium]
MAIIVYLGIGIVVAKKTEAKEVERDKIFGLKNERKDPCLFFIATVAWPIILFFGRA